MDASSTSPPPGLDPALLHSIEEHAVSLAREAGILLLDLFQRSLQIEYKSKGQRDPVSDADLKAEEQIVEGIKGRFPDHAVLSEETPGSQDSDQDFLWVVDPLDGTVNFVNRYPLFSVSIGVLYRGVPVVGSLFIPWPLTHGGHVIHASLGNGAFANEAPIHVYAEAEPSPGGLMMLPPSTWAQFRVGRELRRRFGDMRVTGSIAYELALVASGALQYAAFSSPKIWDVVAGMLIIKEAGGEVLTYSVNHGWIPFRTFFERDTGLPNDGNLRNWGAGVLVGNPTLIEVVANNLRPRSKLWRWLVRSKATRRIRSMAKGWIYGGLASERPDPQAKGPSGGGAPPPPGNSEEDSSAH